MSMDPIMGFRGEHEFLSNFYPIPGGIFGGYPTVEHAFQAAKTLDMHKRQEFKAGSAGNAKRKGRLVSDLRGDWDHVRTSIMYLCVSAKFKVPEMRELLLGTEDRLLVEANHWHDNFWGACLCAKCADIHSQNNLGIILMQVRDSLLSEHYSRCVS